MTAELNEHTVAPPALQPLAHAQPRTLAELGNLMVRRGAYVDALEAYRSAAESDPNDAPAHWMCGEIAHVLGDVETSITFRARALALQRVYADPLPVGTRTPVLLLLRDLPYSVNTPLELILDRRRLAVHKYYLEGDAVPPLPPYAAAFTAFGSARGAPRVLERASAFSPINDPLRLQGTSRENLAGTLAGIDGVEAPAARVLDSASARALTEPVLVRPIDTHAGEGLAYTTDRNSLATHLARHPSDRYHVAPFTEYRSADGYYRKFRVIFVDGAAYPYHLAIAPQWMVHYQTAPMESDPALRAQEAAFLGAPRSFVPHWDEAMPQIARAIGLDYFGIDAAMLADGRLFVFEADAALLVHDEDSGGVFAYKRPYVARIREALHELITRRTRREIP